MVIANPPYVGTKPNTAISALYETARCGDLYAWLLEGALKKLSKSGRLGTIVPLSLMFAGDKAPLRDLILNINARTHLASFDNIPDAIFGTPGQPMNSQRTTLIIIDRGATNNTIFATDHLRWLRDDRPTLFSNLCFANITAVCSREYFPTIGKANLVDFLAHARCTQLTIRDLLGAGPEFLCVPSVARYFISAVPLDLQRRNQEIIRFANEANRKIAFALLNSNIFYWYWRTRSDGFWVSKEQILSFPIPRTSSWENLTRLADELWSGAKVEKFKKMGDKMVKNYYFNNRMDVLLDIDEWIVKQVAPDLNLPRDIFAQYKSNSFLRPLDFAALMGATEEEDAE